MHSNSTYLHIPFRSFLRHLSQFSNNYIYFCQVTTSIFKSSSFFFSHIWQTNPPIAIRRWNPLTIIFSHSISKSSCVCTSVC